MKDFFSGIIIGISTFFPGLSGATAAIILGKYEMIISSVANLRKNYRKNLTFLTLLFFGGLIGVYLASLPSAYLLEKYPVEFGFVISGIICGTVISFADKILCKNLQYIAIGYLLTSFLEYTPINSNGIIGSMIFSLVITLALILPGISITNILFAVDMFDSVITAVKNLDFGYLFSKFIFVPVWIILLSKIFEKAYKKYPIQTNAVVLGTLIASIKEAFPSVTEIKNVSSGIFLFLFGLFSMLFILRIKKFADRRETAL